MSSQTPGYKMLENPKGDLVELIQREENKYYAERPLYVLSAIQIIFGFFLLFAQVRLVDKYFVLFLLLIMFHS